MGVVNEDLAVQQENAIKDSIVVVFKFLAEQIKKIDFSDSLNSNLQYKMDQFLKSEKQSNEHELDTENQENQSEEKTEITKLDKNDVEIIPPDRVNKFNEILNEHEVTYDTYVDGDGMYCIAFEAEDISDIEMTFSDCLDQFKPSLEARIEQAVKMIAPQELGKDIEKTLSNIAQASQER